MKTISFELSKRLNDEGLLDNIGTMYSYNKSGGLGDSFYRRRYIYKTLTLEEAIETLFAGTSIYFRGGRGNGTRWSIDIYSDSIISHLLEDEPEFEGETLLEAVEKMLEYLLNNNLLTK